MHDEFAEEGWHPLDLVVAQMKRIAELEAALKPFADAIDRHDADWKEKIGGDVLVSDDEIVEFLNSTGEYVGLVSIGDFRRARAAMSGRGNPDT